MCGIAGWASVRGTHDANVLGRMTDAVAHRGPDDRGTFIHGAFAFGHRRLSVLDPTPAGHQPMRRGSWVCTYNGEIYNFKALRLELARHDQDFATGTDTEVLLAAAAVWGPVELLQRLDGMFAFALANLDTDELWLARDPSGEKPLYYVTLPDQGIAFASEARALAVHPAVSREFDPVSVRRYLTYDTIPSPGAIFRGMRKLEPGTVLRWHAGRVDPPTRYATRPPTAPVLDSRSAPLALWSALGDAVDSRLVSDVPVGFFLSGGLDSTAVLAAACERRDPSGLDTFTIGFEDPSFDESGPAQAVAAHFGTRHHVEKLSERAALDLVGGLGEALDEPLADPSLVPMTLLARFARQHVTVALSGDGGDEYFYGYPTFAAHGVAEMAARLPAPLREHLLRPLINAVPSSDVNWSIDYQLKRFLEGLDYGPFERHFVWIGGTSPRLHPALFEPAFLMTASREPLFADVDLALAGINGPVLDRLGALYARLYLADGVLQKVDRATMRFGLESRAPLLARGVLEVAARIPAELKLTGVGPLATTKVVLRRALQGKVPKEILDRPKKGFGVPLARWLKGPLLPLLRETLEPTALRKQAIFKAEACEKLIAEHISGFRDHRKTLWALLVFQLWARTLN